MSVAISRDLRKVMTKAWREANKNAKLPGYGLHESSEAPPFAAWLVVPTGLSYGLP